MIDEIVLGEEDSPLRQPIAAALADHDGLRPLVPMRGVHRENPAQALAQFPMRHRLQDVAREPEFREVLGAAHAVGGGQQHEPDIVKARVAGDAASELESVAVRHHVIQNGEIEFSLLGALERLQRGLRTLDADRTHSQMQELPIEYLAVGRVVVDHEDALVREHGGVEARILASVRGCAEAGREPERFYLFVLPAEDAGLALHQHDQAADDGQPESGAAEVTRGGCVELRERLKQGADVRRRNTDAGVADLAADDQARRRQIRRASSRSIRRVIERLEASRNRRGPLDHPRRGPLTPASVFRRRTSAPCFNRSQLDASTTRHFGGTGLGLSIVRRLVVLMQGETGVLSRENEGLTFWFTARFGASTNGGEDASFDAAVLAHKRVLVVTTTRPTARYSIGSSCIWE